jgi:hypothetical protein
VTPSDVSSLPDGKENESGPVSSDAGPDVFAPAITPHLRAPHSILHFPLSISYLWQTELGSGRMWTGNLREYDRLGQLGKSPMAKAKTIGDT